MDDFMNELGRIVGLTLRDHAEAIKTTQKTVYKVAFFAGRNAVYASRHQKAAISASGSRVCARKEGEGIRSGA